MKVKTGFITIVSRSRQCLLIVLLLLTATASHAQKLYTATGKASYYAKKFDGRKTACGECFSNKDLTAAHRTLPFGTRVKVTNVANNKSVIVTINDRGPYIKGRIIDLSHAAADSLDMLHTGWANVKVEELPPEAELIADVRPLPDQSQFHFPNDWAGTWVGDLKIYSEAGLQQVIPMQLNIERLDIQRFTWKIIYDTSVREYELVNHDLAGKVFSIDEKNGIDIMSFLFGDRLLSRFQVGGNWLDCEYEMADSNKIIFEIKSSSSDNTWTTGNVISAGDSIPAVSVYQYKSVQIAELHRSK